MMLKLHVTRAREQRVGDGSTARKTLRVEHRELGRGDSSAGTTNYCFCCDRTGMDLPRHDHVSSITHPSSRIGLDYNSSSVLSSHVFAHYVEF